MVKFGKRRLRSIDSFGVAGLLGEDSPVYYTTVFSVQSLGRISDLLSLRFKKSEIDDRCFRQFLVEGVYEAIRAQNKKTGFFGFLKKDGAAIQDPIFIECGADSEKVVLGISFLVPELPKGIESLRAKPSILGLQSHADQLVIKADSNSKKIEINGLFAVSGGTFQEATPSKPPLEYLVLESPSPQSVPRPQAYLHLGDLDYQKLLKENIPNKKVSGAAPSPTGEIVVPGRNEDEFLQRVKGGSSGAEPEQRISGVTQQTNEEVFLVKGSPSDDVQKRVVIQGAGGDLNNSETFIIKSKKSILNFVHRILPSKDDQQVQTVIDQGEAIQTPAHRVRDLPEAVPLDSAIRKRVGQLEREVEYKNTQLAQVNQLVAQLNEKIDHTSRVDSEYSAKYQMAQKLLLVSKEEGVQLSRRVNELRSQVETLKVQVGGAKFGDRKQSSLHAAEMSMLQKKFDQLYLQSEDLKKANRQLLGEFNSRQRNRMGESKKMEDMQLQLDEAVSNLSKSKREAEVMRNRVMILKRQEIQAKLEIDRLKVQLKRGTKGVNPAVASISQAPALHPEPTPVAQAETLEQLPPEPTFSEEDN